MKLVISPYHDPFMNLSLENYFFRQWEKKEIKNQEDVLLLYINKPSVIMGRFQNPWKEVNWPSLKVSKMQILRRQSGGGTVYHDEGNLNYSFIRGERHIEKEENLKAIIAFLYNCWGVEARQTEQFTLVVDKEDCVYKISGNAFKQGRVSSIHHGTLLIDSSLNTLGDILNALPIEMKTKGIDSRPQPVINLKELNHKLSMESVTRAFQEELSLWSGDLGEIASSDLFKSYLKEIKDPLWIFGETPKFVFQERFDFSWGKVQVKIEVRKGIIYMAHVYSPQLREDWTSVEKALEGKILYDPSTYKILLEDLEQVEKEELKEFFQVFFGWMLMTWGY